MLLTIYTLLHVLISLVGIATGFVVVAGWIQGLQRPQWETWFLATTVATSVTGFFFPFRGFTPAYAVGALSLVVLAAAYYSAPSKSGSNSRPKLHIITATVALYFNFFVLVVQIFKRVPVLEKIAPNQSGPAFGITQGVVMLLFIGLGWAAVSRSRAHSPELA